jgi:hypothetical protein
MACFLFLGLIHAWKDWMKERIVVVETNWFWYLSWTISYDFTQLVKNLPTKNRIENGSQPCCLHFMRFISAIHLRSKGENHTLCFLH